MFNHSNKNEDLDKMIERHEKELEKLKRHHETIQSDTQKLLAELGLTSEEVKKYLDSTSISAESWHTIQQHIDELEEKQRLSRDNLPNPERTKKRQSERNIPPSWIFVK